MGGTCKKGSAILIWIDIIRLSVEMNYDMPHILFGNCPRYLAADPFWHIFGDLTVELRYC